MTPKKPRSKRNPGCAVCGKRIIGDSGLDAGKIAAAMGAKVYCHDCEPPKASKMRQMARFMGGGR